MARNQTQTKTSSPAGIDPCPTDYDEAKKWLKRAREERLKALKVDRELADAQKTSDHGADKHLNSLEALDDVSAWRGNRAWAPIVRLAGRTRSLDLAFSISADTMGVRRPGVRRPGVRRPGIQRPGVRIQRLGPGDARFEASPAAESSASRTDRVGFGWMPDVPDHRDRIASEEFFAKLSQDRTTKKKATPKKGEKKNPAKPESEPKRPKWVDLRPTGLLSPVENQGDTNSCTAHAVTSLLEVLYRRLRGRHEHLSRLFLYKASRNLDGFTTDEGSYIRSAVKAARFFGVPPETSYPFDPAQVNDEPPAYAYAYANTMRTSKYARLDIPLRDGPKGTIENVERVLATGHPVAFGFTVYESLWEPQEHRGEIPYPLPNDQPEGGHAVLAVGYDSEIELPSAKGKGALLIQNSWGPEWGEFGFGYLPYDYIRDELSFDFWAIQNAEWIPDEDFEGEE